MQAASVTNSTTMSRRWMIMIWLCVGYMTLTSTGEPVVAWRKGVPTIFDPPPNRAAAQFGVLHHRRAPDSRQWFVDRFGVKRPWIWGFTFWSLLSAATAIIGRFWQLFAIRLLLGLGRASSRRHRMRWIRYNFAETSAA
jgi:hypothetical protein